MAHFASRWRFRLAVAAVIFPVIGVGAANIVPTSAASGNTDPLAKVNVASLAPASIIGRGPDGSKAAPASALTLSAADIKKAKKAHFKVGVAMQTLNIDWSTNQVRGIQDTLKKYGATVIGVTNPDFDVQKQISDLQNLIQRHPQAIISIPVDDTATASAYKKVGQAGIKLILMDNPPRKLSWPKDYQTLVSSDNQGDGLIAAEVLSHFIKKGGTVGIIGFGVDFFVTKERDAGFSNWMKAHRPDIKIKTSTFLDPSKAGSVATNFLTANPDVSGLFTEWEVPAMAAEGALRAEGKTLPMTSVNLAYVTAVDMAKNGMIKGVGAQVPYDQGVAEAKAAILAMLGKKTPKWVALRAVPVLRKNLFQGYRTVFHQAPPSQLTSACKSAGGCR